MGETDGKGFFNSINNIVVGCSCSGVAYCGGGNTLFRLAAGTYPFFAAYVSSHVPSVGYGILMPPYPDAFKNHGQHKNQPGYPTFAPHNKVLRLPCYFLNRILRFFLPPESYFTIRVFRRRHTVFWFCA